MDNIIAALEHKDRVWEIRLAKVPSQLLKDIPLEPFLTLTYLALHSDDKSAPVLPQSFLGAKAPCLRYVDLECHRRCDNSQTETRISLGCKSDLQDSTRGRERAEVWQKEGTRIWVSTTRRLKLLVQGTLRMVLILLWVQGSSFRTRIRMRMRFRVTKSYAVLAVLHLSYDSTNCAGPVSRYLHWLRFQRLVSSPSR